MSGPTNVLKQQILREKIDLVIGGQVPLTLLDRVIAIANIRIAYSGVENNRRYTEVTFLRQTNKYLSELQKKCICREKE